MNEKYPHIEFLLDHVLRCPAEILFDNPQAVIAAYTDVRVNPKYINDPDGSLLRNELAALLKESDETFIAVTGEPGSQDWEFGVPELDKLKEMFAAYVEEIDKTKR